MPKFNFRHIIKKNRVAIVGRQKSLLKTHLPFLQCKVHKGVLYCYGEFKPTSISTTYKYRIVYKPLRSPRVTLVDPKIDYHDDVHMYPSDNSLCLYHKTDLVWNDKCNIHETIVPWTHEWFVFYELYKITGRWEHPEVKHNSRESKK